MNVIDWFVGGFLTEFSNEFMNVGCLMYVQRVGVNVWIYLCVRVDDGDGCVEKGFDDGCLEIDIEMVGFRGLGVDGKQNNEMCLK